MKLLSATLDISLDEPCYLLSEQNLQSPDSRGWRRYQIITVLRPDLTISGGYRKVEYREDLGPARSFTVDQFNIPGGVQDYGTGRIEIFHTVGQLREMANKLRDPNPHAYPPPEHEPADLIGMYHDWAANIPLARRAVSTFGPGGWTTRS